ncbi:MAG: NADH-quinone oxidoreductase subunit C [Acidobacteria bacterium]|nr:NADH-quinone oxidoreductase subunit C [Acidobacteriota bacterium]
MAPDSLTLRKLKERFPGSVLAVHSYRGDDTAVVKGEDLVSVARFLKEDPELQYNFLMDLTAVDYLGQEPFDSPQRVVLGSAQEGIRFEVVYHFYSLPLNQRVRIKVPVPESDPTVDSVTGLWAGANWFEREVWDMFGIRFKGHPDLRRILLYDGFEGHPLQKDYPLRKRQPRIGPQV